jgi:hypothetical protein
MFNYIAITSVTDTYLNHVDPGTPNLNVHFTTLGRALYLIRCINNVDQEVVGAAMNEEQTRRRDQLCTELDATVSRLPGIDVLTDLVLIPDPDTFFEVLCMNLKNNLCSFQGWLKKIELSNINIIKQNLLDLKADYLANSAEIFNLERRLTDIQDSILQSKVSNFKIFENLNAEKPTPAFLSIARNKTNGKLSGIRNATGNPFLNDSERNNYILNTFQDLIMSSKTF